MLSFGEYEPICEQMAQRERVALIGALVSESRANGLGHTEGCGSISGPAGRDDIG
jgi:hypothetical protein